MPTFRWWIDEPLIRGSANPSDRDLQALRADGFTIAVSLLEESKQPPKYKQESALTAGWSIHSIPVEEGAAPSLEQIRKFMAGEPAISPAIIRSRKPVLATWNIFISWDRSFFINSSPLDRKSVV